MNNFKNDQFYLRLKESLQVSKVFPGFFNDQFVFYSKHVEPYIEAYNKAECADKINVTSNLLTIRNGLERQANKFQQSLDKSLKALKSFVDRSNVSDDFNEKYKSQLDEFVNGFHPAEMVIEDYKALVDDFITIIQQSNLSIRERNTFTILYFKRPFKNIYVQKKAIVGMNIIDRMMRDIIEKNYPESISESIIIAELQNEKLSSKSGPGNPYFKNQALSIDWNKVAAMANKLMKNEPEIYLPRRKNYFISNNLKTVLAEEFKAGETTIRDNLKKRFKKVNHQYRSRNDY